MPKSAVYPIQSRKTLERREQCIPQTKDPSTSRIILTIIAHTIQLEGYLEIDLSLAPKSINVAVPKNGRKSGPRGDVMQSSRRGWAKHRGRLCSIDVHGVQVAGLGSVRQISNSVKYVSLIGDIRKVEDVSEEYSRVAKQAEADMGGERASTSDLSITKTNANVQEFGSKESGFEDDGADAPKMNTAAFWTHRDSCSEWGFDRPFVLLVIPRSHVDFGWGFRCRCMVERESQCVQMFGMEIIRIRPHGYAISQNSGVNISVNSKAINVYSLNYICTSI
ncbi:hypothetical protein IW262DRAFT_1477637 [Armillaria fumosa]|nr:hypothetical protein IW262DRAFT_1477637 [Armillaria fumosa]